MTRPADWITRPRQQAWRLDLHGGRRHRYDRTWGSRGNRIQDAFSRLYLLSAGTGLVEGEGWRCPLRPGRLYLFAPGCRAVYSTATGCDLAWIHFGMQVQPGQDALASLDRPRQAVATPALRRDLLRLIDLLPSARPGDGLEAVGLLAGLVVRLLPESWDDLAPAQEGGRFRGVLAFMEEHLDRPLALAGLARVAGLHPTYFSNRFAAVCGEPPLRRLERLRLERARRLLADGDLPVAAVAARVGYHDPFHFSRAFRRRYGIPPSAARDLP